MTDVDWRDDRDRAVFARAGLASLEALAGCRDGVLVTTARTRWLRRLELDGATWFVKCQDLRGVGMPPARWLSWITRGLPVAREARALARLAQLGFRVPEVVATAATRRGFVPRLALLVTRAVVGHVDLVSWLATGPEAAMARRTMDAADELLRRAHARGLVLLGAKYRNLLVPPSGAATADDIVVIDQPDLRASCSARLRRKDWWLLRRDRERYGGGR